MGDSNTSGTLRASRAEWWALGWLILSAVLAVCLLPWLLGCDWACFPATALVFLVPALVAGGLCVGFHFSQREAGYPWHRGLDRHQQALVYGSGAAVLGSWLLLGVGARAATGEVRWWGLVGGLAWCLLLGLASLELLSFIGLRLTQGHHAPSAGAAGRYARAVAVTAASTLFYSIFGALTGAMGGNWFTIMIGFCVGSLLGAWCCPLLVTTAELWSAFSAGAKVGTVALPIVAWAVATGALWNEYGFFGSLCGPLLAAPYWFQVAVRTQQLARRLIPVRAWTVYFAALSVLLLPTAVVGVSPEFTFSCQLIVSVLLAAKYLVSLETVEPYPLETRTALGSLALVAPIIFTVHPVATANAAWFDWLLGHFTVLPR